MARERNVQKVAKALKGEAGRFSDGSASWVHLENEKYCIDIIFDGKGENFEKITIAKKVYAVVKEEMIADIKL